jgi:hypothetical protein
MTTFAVTDPAHTLDALNYALSNLGAATGLSANNVLTVDNVTNQVTVGVGGEIYSYNVQYLNIRYATNATGTQGFSTSPTNAGYYGLQATAAQYPSTISDPGYYTWNQVAGGFGTTNFLFYQTPGGRQITFDIGTTAPNSNFLVVSDGTLIDLDIVTTTFIANSVITGNNIVPGTITGNLIAANTITSVNIATNTITGNNIALYTIQANNIANGVIAVSNVSNGNSNIQVNNNGAITMSVTGTANVLTVNSGNIVVAGNVSATGNVDATGNVNAAGYTTAGNANIDGGSLRTAAATAFVFTQGSVTTMNIGTGSNVATMTISAANSTVTIRGLQQTLNGNANVNGNLFVNGYANIGANGLNVNGGGNLVISSGNITVGGANSVAYFKTTAATGVLYNTATTVLIGNQNANTGNAVFSGNIVGNLAISAVGNITTAVNIKASYQLLTPVAFASLPAVTQGARAFITDGNLSAVGNFGNTVSGGGGNNTPVWSDGADWYIG